MNKRKPHQPKFVVKPDLRDSFQAAVRAHEFWVVSLVYERLATGRKIQVFTIVDAFSRSLLAELRFTFRGTDVVKRLEAVCKQVWLPPTIVIDQHSEFVLPSRELDRWAGEHDVMLRYTSWINPSIKGNIEAFIGRAKCLNALQFMNLADAKKTMEVGENPTTNIAGRNDWR